MRALHKMYTGNAQNFAALNTSMITLLRKKDDPMALKDCRPVSLIHGVSKIFTRILAARLDSRIDGILSPAQTTFVEGRCIHENFVYVRGVARKFHREHKAAMILKLDIAKANDTVAWDFLLGLLKHLGFGESWRHWICHVNWPPRPQGCGRMEWQPNNGLGVRFAAR